MSREVVAVGERRRNAVVAQAVEARRATGGGGLEPDPAGG
jgi:hypothetical protein